MVFYMTLEGRLQVATFKIRDPQLAIFVEKIVRAMHENGTVPFGFSDGGESPAAAMAFAVDQSPHSATAVESYASILALYLSVLAQIVQSLCSNGHTGPISMRAIAECPDLIKSPPSGRFTSSQIPPASSAELALMRIMSIVAAQATGDREDFARDLMNASVAIVTSVGPVIPVFIATCSNQEVIASNASIMAEREATLQLTYTNQPTPTPTRQQSKKPSGESASLPMDVDDQQQPPLDESQQPLPSNDSQQQPPPADDQSSAEAGVAPPPPDAFPPGKQAAPEPFPEHDASQQEAAAENQDQGGGQTMIVEDEEDEALDYEEDDDEQSRPY